MLWGTLLLDYDNEEEAASSMAPKQCVEVLGIWYWYTYEDDHDDDHDDDDDDDDNNNNDDNDHDDDDCPILMKKD